MSPTSAVFLVRVAFFQAISVYDFIAIPRYHGQLLHYVTAFQPHAIRVNAHRSAFFCDEYNEQQPSKVNQLNMFE